MPTFQLLSRRRLVAGLGLLAIPAVAFAEGAAEHEAAPVRPKPKPKAKPAAKPAAAGEAHAADPHAAAAHGAEAPSRRTRPSPA